MPAVQSIAKDNDRDWGNLIVSSISKALLIAGVLMLVYQNHMYHILRQFDEEDGNPEHAATMAYEAFSEWNKLREEASGKSSPAPIPTHRKIMVFDIEGYYESASWTCESYDHMVGAPFLQGFELAPCIQQLLPIATESGYQIGLACMETEVISAAIRNRTCVYYDREEWEEILMWFVKGEIDEGGVQEISFHIHNAVDMAGQSLFTFNRGIRGHNVEVLKTNIYDEDVHENLEPVDEPELTEVSHGVYKPLFNLLRAPDQLLLSRNYKLSSPVCGPFMFILCNSFVYSTGYKTPILFLFHTDDEADLLYPQSSMHHLFKILKKATRPFGNVEKGLMRQLASRLTPTNSLFAADLAIMAIQLVDANTWNMVTKNAAYDPKIFDHAVLIQACERLPWANIEARFVLQTMSLIEADADSVIA